MLRNIIVILIISVSIILAVAGPLRMGDHLMERGEYYEALEEYRRAENEDPDNPEVLWRVGAALTRVAQDIQGNSRHDSLEIATNYLNRAIVEDSEILKAHLEYARALGHLALFKPDWDDVRVARRVREELMLVMEEEPNNPEALYLMGLWHRWVCPKPMLMRRPNDLGAACMDSAAYYLRQAGKEDKDNLEFDLELAKIYLAMDTEGAAKEVLQKIIDTKNVPEKSAQIVERAKLMLYQIENPDTTSEGEE